MTLLVIAAFIPAALVMVGIPISRLRRREPDQPAHIESGRSHMRTKS